MLEYIKARIPSSKLVKEVNSIIVRKLKKIKPNVGQYNLEKLHLLIPPEQINEFRIACFEAINMTDWAAWLLVDCKALISRHVGPDFCIQSKLNLSIVPPRDRSSQLPLHSDSWTGESPFQVNFWIPLGSARGDSGIFIVRPKESLRVIRFLEKNGRLPRVRESEIVNINARKNQIVLFNPALLHGSGLNSTQFTRLSLNVRVKNFFAPDFSDKYPDRHAASYYSYTALSQMSDYGLRYWQAVHSGGGRD
jgi:sporadic carbohydrate cluster 2OG-Fe(II) oxygenase